MPHPAQQHHSEYRTLTNSTISQKANPTKLQKTKMMSKQWLNSGLLSSTSLIVRWCQRRMNPCVRSPAAGRNIHGEEAKSPSMVTRPPSPPPRYDQISRIAPIPVDWQLSMGPKNSVLRGNHRPDENASRRDPNVLWDTRVIVVQLTPVLISFYEHYFKTFLGLHYIHATVLVGMLLLRIFAFWLCLSYHNFIIS